MSRGYQRLMGDKLFFFVTVFGNLVISLVLGSVFYDLPSDASSINSRCILLFFAILFNGLSSALEVRALGFNFGLSRKTDVVPDSDPLRPTSHCRETCAVRPIPPILGSCLIYNLRPSLQDSLYFSLQYPSLLHGRASTGSWRVLHLSPIRVHLHFDHVYDPSNHWTVLESDSSSFDASCFLHSGSSHLHWLYSSDTRYARMASLDQLH